MATWFVYLVQCADQTLYTGITTDLEARIARHNAGTGAKYTRSRRPVHLAWHKRMRSESAARKQEYAIKQLTRQEKQHLIQSIKFS